MPAIPVLTAQWVSKCCDFIQNNIYIFLFVVISAESYEEIYTVNITITELKEGTIHS